MSAAARRLIVPPFLRGGERIDVVAPSGVVDPARLRAGVRYLEERGHPVRLAPHAEAEHGYLAGPDQERLEDLNEAIASRETAAILFARGGYGLTRILGRIDLAGLRRRPRLLLGYSDATALFMALQRRGPYLVHYGPSASEMADASTFDEGSLWGALRGSAPAFRVPFGQADVLRPGKGSGPLIGGCLTLLVSLLGTRFDHDYAGAILFWEEVNEEPYRIDRMLSHLRNAGKLDRLKGMVVGALTGCEPRADRPSLTIREIVLEAASGGRYPIVWNVRAGHVRGKITLPLGPGCTLDTGRGELSVHLPGRRRTG